jgi:phytoene desaturase
MSKKKAIIVGAGIAGIATAIRLANVGIEAEIIEASDKPGGKLAEIRQDGFRFDMGPSLFTLPELTDEITALAAEGFISDFAYEKLPVVTKYFWQDGTTVNAYAQPEKLAEELEKKIKLPEQKTKAFLQNSRKIYELTSDVFLTRSLHNWETYFSKAAFKGYFSVRTVNPFGNMHRFNENFFKNAKAVQLFDRFATYNGSNPFEAPATLNVIPHLEHNLGAFFPKAGMRSIIEHFIKVAESLNVKISTGERVIEIEHDKKRIKGVKTDKRTLPADIVVCNADMRFAYKHLIKHVSPPHRVINAPKSSSALIFYWAMKGNYPQFDLHNIFFSEDYAREFDCMFREKNISDDPTVYLFISSKFCAADAPEGCENWFVMVNAPENTGQDWDDIILRTRKSIEAKLQKFTGVNLEENRIFEHILDPRGIEARTSSSGGSLYGNSSNNVFAAFLRHPNYSSKLKGLYFAGGSVHPGGGIPLCLLSAKITSEMIQKNLSRLIREK